MWPFNDRKDRYITALKAAVDQLEDSYMGLHQRWQTEQEAKETMLLHRDNAMMEKVAAQMAEEIADIYAGGSQSVEVRNTKVYRIILAEFQRIVRGEVDWDINHKKLPHTAGETDG